MKITPKELFVAFFRIGVQGFGGVLPWARRVLVEERHWFGEEEFLDAWSVAQVLPGGNIINLSISFGARCAGSAGAAAALFGLTLAPLLIICALAAIYVRFGELVQVGRVFGGVSAAGAGLMVATSLRMAASPRMRSPLAVFAVAAFTLTVLLRWPLLLVLAVLVPFSFFLVWWRAR